MSGRRSRPGATSARGGGIPGWGKGHKYGAKATWVDGVRFASRKEARRYAELKLLEKAGEIRSLELQPRFRIEVCGVLICHYVGDFAYVERGEAVIEDVKGVKTAAYRIKRKLMLAVWGIEIRET